MPARRVSTTRRGALGGALGLVLLSACDVDDLRPPEEEATPVPSPTPGATETPEPEADTVLAEETAYAVATAAVIVDRVRRSFPRLRGRLQLLARMHRTHLGVLEPPEDRSIPVPDAGDTPAEALDRVRTAEQALQRSLASAAVEAQSGALARLLASMSASVSQHLAGLPPGPTAGGGPLTRPTSSEVDVLQEVLGNEHAAVYLYGVLGARTSESATPDLYITLRAAHDAHRERRGELTGWVSAEGATPVAAATAYEVASGLETAGGVTSAALDLERACAEVYAAAVASTTSERRAWAVDALNDAAVRALGLRGTPEMFPGADEYADR